MKTSFLRQTTDDKLVLHGLLYEPDEPTKKLILHIHGMSGNFYENRFLDFMAKTFTDNDWAFLAPNNRGHDFIADIPVAGNKEKFKRIGNSYEIFEECILDIKTWMDFAEKKGFSEIVLQGHSLGCSKVVYYFVKTLDKRISKLVLASPSDMVGLFESPSDHKNLLSLSKKMLLEGKGDEFLPKLIWGWYSLSAKTYLDFSERDNPIDIFNTYDKNKESVLAKIKIPVLAFLGEKDDAAILPIKEALAVIKKKAKNAPRFDTEVIEGAPHSYFGHEQEVADLIINWVKK